MSVASDLAVSCGFDIHHFLGELGVIKVRKWYVKFDNYSEYGRLDRWVRECSEWREEYSRRRYRYLHDAGHVRLGIYGELCAGVVLYPECLERWLPSVAVESGGDNSGQDFRMEWSGRLSCDVEVKCVRSWHRWVPVDVLRLGGSGLVVVEKRCGSIFRVLGVASFRRVGRFARHVPDIGEAFPRDSLISTF